MVTGCPVWMRASAFSGTEATTQTRARSAMAIDRRGRVAAVFAGRHRHLDDLAVDRRSQLRHRIPLFALTPNSRSGGRHRLDGARLFQPSRGDGQLVLRGQQVFLGYRPIRKQVARPAHIGVRLGQSRLPLLHVGLSLPPMPIAVRKRPVSRP